MRQEGRCLLGGKAQLVDPELENLTAGAQAAEREGRINTCQEKDMQVGWLMLQQKPEGIMNGWLANHMIIVEDEKIGCRPAFYLEKLHWSRYEDWLRQAEVERLIRQLPCMNHSEHGLSALVEA